MDLDHLEYKDTKRRRDVTTKLRYSTPIPEPGEVVADRSTDAAANHWDGVATIGQLHRTGTRLGKDGTVHQIDETLALFIIVAQ